MFSVLSDRKLWYDGDSSYNPKLIKKLVQTHDVKYVDKMTEDIVQINRLLAQPDQIQVKTELKPFCTEWNIPEKFLKLDLVDHITYLHTRAYYDDPQFEQREERLALELVLFRRFQMESLLRAILHIINSLTKNKCVWGVGRGSSVASYVLFVIGLHDIDSFAFDLDVAEFFHN